MPQIPARLLPRLRPVYLSWRFNRSREEKNRLRASATCVDKMPIDAGRITWAFFRFPLSEDIPADKPPRCIPALAKETLSSDQVIRAFHVPLARFGSSVSRVKNKNRR